MPADPAVLGSVRSMRRKLAEDGPMNARAEGDFERLSLPRGDADVLRDLLIAENARVVIEIGLAYGSSRSRSPRRSSRATAVRST